MIGEIISHYKILEKLGEGGMGVVYKAEDLKLHRFVALKFLPPFYTKDESSRQRFIVEAQSASGLDHPNICNIHEINETLDGQLYISMAYYKGESLRQKIKKGPIPFEKTLNIIFQIAKGLSAAHAENIVHRDIKPANIIITDKGEVKIVDFGLAKLDEGKLTQSLSTKGTIAYMSPAVIRDLPVDHRTDIWSLGILMFEMLTGQLPFEGSYAEPMMYSIVNEEPKLLSQYLDNVPQELQLIIERLLKKEEKESYNDISELLNDLSPLVKERITIEVKTQPTIVKYLPAKKSYVYTTAATLLIILFLIFGRSFLFPEIRLENKIAVLPLANISNEIGEEWLTEGMTDALITELAQIGGLSVISRFSSMHYKGTTKQPPDIAAELGVNYLIDGSLLRMGELVKISARLINAQNNDYIWAKEYERDFKNILGLQGEIAKAIASQIEVKLTPQEETLLTKHRPVNPETYEMYMKGMFHLNKLTPEGIERGLSYLQQSIENNPNEPMAHAGIALAYLAIAHGAVSPIPDPLARAKTATLNALELDSTLAEAHLALALVTAFHDRDWVNAEKSNNRALELNPNLALAQEYIGLFCRIRGENDGYGASIRAKQLDPLNPAYSTDLAWSYYFDGKFDESIDECFKSLEINPEYWQAYCILGHAYAGKGMFDEAITNNKMAAEHSLGWEWGLAHTYAVAGDTLKALKITSEIEKRNLVWDTWCLAMVFAALGDGNKVFYWLEQAYQRRHPFIQWIGTFNAYLSAFKDDPRYKDLLQRMNLPE
jgi:eukaryotic-like serine/threonine-protein kinase